MPASILALMALSPALGQDAARTACGCIVCERLADRFPVALGVPDGADHAALVIALEEWLTAALADDRRLYVLTTHTVHFSWDRERLGERPVFDAAVFHALGGIPIAYFEIELGGVFTRSGPPDARTREQWGRCAIADAELGIPFHVVIPAALSDRQRRGALAAMGDAIRTARARAGRPELPAAEVERLARARTWTWTRATE